MIFERRWMKKDPNIQRLTELNVPMTPVKYNWPDTFIEEIIKLIISLIIRIIKS